MVEGETLHVRHRGATVRLRRGLSLAAPRPPQPALRGSPRRTSSARRSASLGLAGAGRARRERCVLDQALRQWGRACHRLVRSRLQAELQAAARGPGRSPPPRETSADARELGEAEGRARSLQEQLERVRNTHAVELGRARAEADAERRRADAAADAAAAAAAAATAAAEEEAAAASDGRDPEELEAQTARGAQQLRARLEVAHAAELERVRGEADAERRRADAATDAAAAAAERHQADITAGVAAAEEQHLNALDALRAEHAQASAESARQANAAAAELAALRAGAADAAQGAGAEAVVAVHQALAKEREEHAAEREQAARAHASQVVALRGEHASLATQLAGMSDAVQAARSREAELRATHALALQEQSKAGEARAQSLEAQLAAALSLADDERQQREAAVEAGRQQAAAMAASALVEADRQSRESAERELNAGVQTRAHAAEVQQLRVELGRAQAALEQEQENRAVAENSVRSANRALTAWAWAEKRRGRLGRRRHSKILQGWRTLARSAAHRRQVASRRCFCRRLERSFRRWCVQAAGLRAGHLIELAEARASDQMAAAASEAGESHHTATLQLTAMQARCKDLEAKAVAASLAVAEQLAEAEQLADARLAESERLHENRRQWAQQEAAARLAAEKESGARTQADLKRSCARELASERGALQAQFASAQSAFEDELKAAQTRAEAQTQLAESAVERCSAWQGRAETHLRRQTVSRWFWEWVGWRRAADQAERLAETVNQCRKRRHLQLLLRRWARTAMVGARSRLFAGLLERRCASQPLLWAFESWAGTVSRSRLMGRLARFASFRLGISQLSRSFWSWAAQARVAAEQASAAHKLVQLESGLGVATQQVQRLQEEIADGAEMSAQRASVGDARADERVRLVEACMTNRMALLRQETEARIQQQQREAENQRCQLAASAQRDVASVERKLAARSLQAEADIAAAVSQAESQAQALRDQLEQVRQQSHEDQEMVRREAAEQAAEVEARVALQLHELESSAEQRVRQAQSEAERLVRETKQVAHHADATLLQLQDDLVVRHQAEKDQLARQAEERLAHAKRDLEDQVASAQCDSASLRQAIVAAEERARATERRAAVRRTLFPARPFRLRTHRVLSQEVARESQQQGNEHIAAMERRHKEAMARVQREAALELDALRASMHEDRAVAEKEYEVRLEMLEATSAEKLSDALKGSQKLRVAAEEAMRGRETEFNDAQGELERRLAAAEVRSAEIASQSEQQVAQTKEECEAKLRMVARLNDANATVAKAEAESALETATAQLRERMGAEHARAHAAAEERLAEAKRRAANDHEAHAEAVSASMAEMEQRFLRQKEAADRLATESQAEIARLKSALQTVELEAAQRVEDAEKHADVALRSAKEASDARAATVAEQSKALLEERMAEAAAEAEARAAELQHAHSAEMAETAALQERRDHAHDADRLRLVESLREAEQVAQERVVLAEQSAGDTLASYKQTAEAEVAAAHEAARVAADEWAHELARVERRGARKVRPHRFLRSSATVRSSAKVWFWCSWPRQMPRSNACAKHCAHHPRRTQSSRRSWYAWSLSC